MTAKRGGQPGNKNNSKGKSWTDALRRQLAQYTDDKIAMGEALNEIAKTCVMQAIAGCKDARAEIANRIEGKITERIEGDFTHHVAAELTDEQLLAIARGSSDRAADAPGGEENPPGLH